MKIDELALITKNDIPFTPAQITIHQPSINEIGMVGEKNFFMGCQLLTVSKNQFSDEEVPPEATNFDIFESIIQDKNPVSQRSRVCAQQVLLLLFPRYQVQFLPRSIAFIENKGKEQKPQVHQIDASTFDDFKVVLRQMLVLDKIFGQNSQYNIDENDARAKYLRDKFRKRKQKLAKINGEKGQDNSIFSRYISILAVGQKKSINTLKQYSVYQLIDQFNRFTAKQQFDIYVQAKTAGASDLKEVKNWMGDLTDDSSKDT